MLEARLRSRSKDTEAQMQRRLAWHAQEVDAVEEYDYVVINDEVEPAVSRACRDCRRRARATAIAMRATADAHRPSSFQPRRTAPVSAVDLCWCCRTLSPRGLSPALDSILMSLIALGVTGGIGAYKAVEIARGLQKRGHDVAAIMTRSARRGSSVR